jgi:hypothetical protein
VKYPDDRVLVGVVNRRRDFEAIRDEGWYRIPLFSAPLCVDADYLAFYLSGKFNPYGGMIAFYARRTGFELARRRELLPGESGHPRANQLYFKLQFRTLETKTPPITNPTKRPVSFIYTTWERFNSATVIADLYNHGNRARD